MKLDISKAHYSFLRSPDYKFMKGIYNPGKNINNFINYITIYKR